MKRRGWRAPRGSRCESPLEQAFWDKHQELRLPVLSGANLTGGRGWMQPQYEAAPYRLDFAIAELLLAVEIDGVTYHSTPRQLAEDGLRQKRLEARGWRFVRWGSSDLEMDLEGCVRRTAVVASEQLDEALERRLGSMNPWQLAALEVEPLLVWHPDLEDWRYLRAFPHVDCPPSCCSDPFNIEWEMKEKERSLWREKMKFERKKDRRTPDQVLQAFLDSIDSGGVE